MDIRHRAATPCKLAAIRCSNTLAAGLLLAISAGLAGCDGGGSSSGGSVIITPPATTQRVALDFAARAGSIAIDCDNAATGMGVTEDHTLAIKDFRLYIGNIRLVKASGAEARITLDANSAQLSQGGDSVALLDFTNRGGGDCSGASKTPRVIITGTVPTGSYTGVRFELGVPAALNHSAVATAASPLNIATLSGTALEGRKFLKIDSTRGSGAATVSQSFQLASSGCAANPADPAQVTCTHPYRPTITLPAFNSNTQTIVADYQLLLADTDLAASFSCTPGTSPLCQLLTAKAGADSAGASNGTQNFFRVE